MRSYNFPVHKHLPLAVLDYEQRQKNLLMLGIELEVNYRNDCKKHTIHKRIEERRKNCLYNERQVYTISTTIR